MGPTEDGMWASYLQLLRRDERDFDTLPSGHTGGFFLKTTEFVAIGVHESTSPMLPYLSQSTI